MSGRIRPRDSISRERDSSSSSDSLSKAANASCHTATAPSSKLIAASSLQRVEQKGARLVPIAFHRRRRQLQEVGDFLIGQSCEIAHLDYLVAARVDLLQCPQCGVQDIDLLILEYRLLVAGDQRNDLGRAAPAQ